MYENVTDWCLALEMIAFFFVIRLRTVRFALGSFTGEHAVRYARRTHTIRCTDRAYRHAPMTRRSRVLRAQDREEEEEEREVNFTLSC